MEPLSRLLRPSSIAVIGGGAWCANVIAECRKIGFAGPVWPVHPTKTEVAGLRAYPTIADLPEAPDATFIGVNRAASIDTLRALAARGAGGAVCFASGFREAAAETGDGAELEAELVAAAGPMRILGPNCYGFLNLLDGAALWPDQHGALRVERGVALITQSSNIAINLTMQTRGLPIAYAVTAGNQAQTGMAEIARRYSMIRASRPLACISRGSAIWRVLHPWRRGRRPWANPSLRSRLVPPIKRGWRPCRTQARLRAAMRGPMRYSRGLASRGWLGWPSCWKR